MLDNVDLAQNTKEATREEPGIRSSQNKGGEGIKKDQNQPQDKRTDKEYMGKDHQGEGKTPGRGFEEVAKSSQQNQASQGSKDGSQGHQNVAGKDEMRLEDDSAAKKPLDMAGGKQGAQDQHKDNKSGAEKGQHDKKSEENTKSKNQSDFGKEKTPDQRRAS